MIQIENMTFAYAKSKENIHTNISLSLTENKIYGLLGKNGTGKSTLLYLIAGLLKPTDGRVTADGISTTERRQATLEDMFIINEEFTLPQIKLSEWSHSLSRFYPKYDEETFQNSLNEFEIKADRLRASCARTLGLETKLEKRWFIAALILLFAYLWAVLFLRSFLSDGFLPGVVCTILFAAVQALPVCVFFIKRVRRNEFEFYFFFEFWLAFFKFL